MTSAEGTSRNSVAIAAALVVVAGVFTLVGAALGAMMTTRAQGELTALELETQSQLAEAALTAEDARRAREERLDAYAGFIAAGIQHLNLENESLRAVLNGDLPGRPPEALQTSRDLYAARARVDLVGSGDDVSDALNRFFVLLAHAPNISLAYQGHTRMVEEVNEPIHQREFQSLFDTLLAVQKAMEDDLASS